MNDLDSGIGTVAIVIVGMVGTFALGVVIAVVYWMLKS